MAMKPGALATPPESVATVAVSVFVVENLPLAPKTGARKATDAPATGVPLE